MEHDVVTFFDPDSPAFRPLSKLIFVVSIIFLSVFSTISVLMFIPVLLSGLTYFTHRKIMKQAQLMSTENRSLQTRLTALLLAQVNYRPPSGLKSDTERYSSLVRNIEGH